MNFMKSAKIVSAWMLGGVQAIRPSKCDLQKKTVWCKLPSYLAERCGKKQKSTTSNCLHPPGTSPFYLEGGRFFSALWGENFEDLQIQNT